MKVSGESMSPTLHNGDYIFIKTRKPRTLRAELIYVINHTDLGRIIKRLDHCDKKELYDFKGDNPASVPQVLTRSIPKDHIIGQALWAITKTGIKRLF